MAHFAQIDSLGSVQQVIVVNNLVLQEPDYSFPQTESLGQEFIRHTLQLSGTWKQTSYSSSFRKNYAGVGFTYDEHRDAFIPQKPYPSFVLNESTCQWDPPIPYPSDNKNYIWDEESLSWKEIINDPV